MPKYTNDEKHLCHCINDAKIVLKGKEFTVDLERREILYIYAIYLFARNYPGYTTQDLKDTARKHPSDFWVFKDLIKIEPKLVEVVRSLGFSDTCAHIAGLSSNINK